MSLALCSLLEIQQQKTLLFKSSRPGETGKETVIHNYTVMVLDIKEGALMDGWVSIPASLLVKRG